MVELYIEVASGLTTEIMSPTIWSPMSKCIYPLSLSFSHTLEWTQESFQGPGWWRASVAQHGPTVTLLYFVCRLVKHMYAVSCHGFSVRLVSRHCLSQGIGMSFIYLFEIGLDSLPLVVKVWTPWRKVSGFEPQIPRQSCKMWKSYLFIINDNYL